MSATIPLEPTTRHSALASDKSGSTENCRDVLERVPETVSLRGAVASRLCGEIRQNVDRHPVWTRDNLGSVLIEVLMKEGFDWNGPAHPDRIKELLVDAYRIARYVIPEERRRF